MTDKTPKTALSFVTDQLTVYCESLTSDEPLICRKIREQAQTHVKSHWTSGPLVGTLLKMLVSLMRANRVLDIGTFHGYSAAYMATAHPNVKVVSLERDQEMALKAKSLISDSSVATQIQIKNAEAWTWLSMQIQSELDFDLIFFDADKSDLMRIRASLLNALKPGGILIMDNACVRGTVLSPTKLWERETAAFNLKMKENRSFLTTLLPIRDGVLLAYKLSSS
jgi:caffeoyl-CoA O-methyltransferase